MRVLITGACGFVGSNIAKGLLEYHSPEFGTLELYGLDNLSRKGSELNRAKLEDLSMKFFHSDLRLQDEINRLPCVDWVIDAAAETSVLAGVPGGKDSRDVIENNLYSTVNLLEYCKKNASGFILLSTSRVYSIRGLRNLPLKNIHGSFDIILDDENSPGQSFSNRGIREEFSTEAPISLYGVTKLASEKLAIEYSSLFDFPVWINRCGVLSGAGQFGRPDQGIFSYWIHSYSSRKPLKYIGFDGKGSQVRDCFHPLDLIPLICKQFKFSNNVDSSIFNIGGGQNNSISLFGLSNWCKERFGFDHEINHDPVERPFDVPWLVMDSSKADNILSWKPERSLNDILQEIADFAIENPSWLDISGS